MSTSFDNPQSNGIDPTGNQWHYEKNGERKGGFDQQQIIDLIRSGTLTYGSMVWKKGMAAWAKIEQTELRQHLEEFGPPPLTGSGVNNKIVWLIAFAPIIGYLLESFVAGLFGANEAQWERAMSENRYWYVTLALNIGLSVLDSKRLKQAGHDVSHFKGWVFVVPVYLYQRSKLLNQNLAYFITWIVCFVLSMAAHQG
ncbi:DUF4339 domain-containing protein [Pseudomonas sp. GD04087]|uniref:DUF4339 domain-containing protein n=1 Tax=unclassified Pseudomonas TaxID=196821 RepID=UPI00244C329C|nr:MULTISPECIES: DUF4339 domain-containing protein [unclassified Pseudomonas]MDH0293184.1 DUF4339 domain-containing protein [Pseudomonas sp. GD04087]MDH1052958.1 DUF4339 domain-containing protein [Pseudomonas sp. GD03903]MDH2003419.1 DUF4339 domain-containing protein [Pseudomonas sp. GD03691]